MDGAKERTDVHTRFVILPDLINGKSPKLSLLDPAADAARLAACGVVRFVRRDTHA